MDYEENEVYQDVVVKLSLWEYTGRLATYFVIHDGIDKHCHTVLGQDLEKNRNGQDLEKNRVHRAFANILCCSQFGNIDCANQCIMQISLVHLHLQMMYEASNFK